MIVTEEVEEYELDRNMNIVSTHRESKVYNVRGYKKYDFNRLNSHQAKAIIQENTNQTSNTNSTHPKERKLQQQQQISHPLNRQHKTSHLNQKSHPSLKRLPPSNTAHNLKSIILAILLLSTIALVIITQFFPQSNYNILSPLKIGNHTSSPQGSQQTSSPL